MASLTPISGPLGESKAAHLLRRATMGPTLAHIQDFATMDFDTAFAVLTAVQSEPALPIDPLSGTDWIYPNSKHPDTFHSTIVDYTRSWWLENMRRSGPNLTDRMVWFYHTHFPMIMSRIEGFPQFAIDYLRLLRFYALGNYKKLAKAICIDHAMLIHLDGNLNVKGVPQENFAREFLELFTVGKGAEAGPGNYTHFTEQDVQALTKVFTGWGIDLTFQTIDPATNLPTGRVKSGNGTISSQHDVSVKQFSSAFNNAQITTTDIQGTNTTVNAVYQELDDAIDMIFASSHTAKHICRRIYREFVYFDITPEIEADIIEPLATILENNDFELTSVLEVLFKSEHFYDLDTPITSDNNIGAIIKSPIDLTIGTLRLFELLPPDAGTNLDNHYALYAELIHQLDLQGLDLFEPYDVAGYDPYFQFPDFQRYWISSNYLANRYKLAERLITGIENNSGVLLLKLDVVQFVVANCTDPADPDSLLSELVSWLFPIAIDNDRYTYFRDAVLLDQLSAFNWANEWTAFQNSGNDANVRGQLETLFLAMMQSPEYQLY